LSSRHFASFGGVFGDDLPQYLFGLFIIGLRGRPFRFAIGMRLRLPAGFDPLQTPAGAVAIGTDRCAADFDKDGRITLTEYADGDFGLGNELTCRIG